jgi:hypothetical protein
VKATLLLLLPLAGCSPAPDSVAVADQSEAVESTAVFRWDGGQQLPATLGYTPTANYDANNCELWVNGLGNGNFENGGFTENWLETYVSVPRPGGKVLNVGFLVHARPSAGGATTQAIVLGNPIAPAYYASGFYYLYTSRETDLVVNDFAFFVDVQRPSGEIVRLWQSANGHNYRTSDTFALPPSGTKSLGGGEVVYANEGARVFDQKHVCQ